MSFLDKYRKSVPGARETQWKPERRVARPGWRKRIAGLVKVGRVGRILCEDLVSAGRHDL